MGDYNPYAPFVVGMELVPVVETQIQFNPTVDHIEYGYAFRITEPVVVKGAIISRHRTEPGEDIAGGTKQVNIYRYPLQSPGTVETELIPVNSADVTGVPEFQYLANTFYSGSYGSTSNFYAYVLSAPENKKSNIFETNIPAIPLGVEKWAWQAEIKRLSFGFAVSEFEEVLDGNRILNVSLLYSGYALQKQRSDGAASAPPADANNNIVYTDHMGLSWKTYDGEYFAPWKGQAANSIGGTFGSDPSSTFGNASGVDIIAWINAIAYPPSYALDNLEALPHYNPDPDYNYMGTYNGSTGANDPTTGSGVLDITVKQYNPVTARWETEGQVAKTLDLGDIVVSGPTASPIYNSLTETDPPIPQWTYGRLKALDINSDAASKRQMIYNVQLSPGAGAAGDGISGSATFFIDYMVMMVTRTGAENRLGVGAGAVGDYTSSYYRDAFSTNGTSVTVFDTVSNYLNVGPPDPPDPLNDPQPQGTYLAAGNYVVTLSSPYAGDRGGSFNKAAVFPSPKYAAVRPLYQLPSHPGVQVSIPYSSGLGNAKVGEAITISTSAYIPQIILEVSGHSAASGGYETFILPESQAYGTQIASQVFGTNITAQVIDDDVVLSSEAWPWIRFYARRKPQTTQPLTVTIGSSSTSITVDDFDDLDELTSDGWREVTLRFATYPEFGVGSRPSVVWSSYGASAGSRWEVMGASSLIKRTDNPGFEGFVEVGAGYYDPTAFPEPATYGGAETVDGFDVTPVGATWFPWSGSHAVTTPTYDPATDITVLLSQDPPMVSGLEVTPTLQTLEDVDADACGFDSCCIPTGLWYNKVTWQGKPPGSDTYTVISLKDTFGRSVTGSWGEVEFGGLSYQLTGSSTGVYTVEDDNKGYMTVASGTKTQVLDTSAIADDFDLSVTMTNETSVTDANALTLGVWFRIVDSNNRLEANVVRTIDGVTLTVIEVVGGTPTTLWSETIDYLAIEAGSAARMRVLASDRQIKVKVWPATVDESAMWNFEYVLSSAATGTEIGFVATNDSSSSRLVSFSDLEVTPPRFWFGYYELQRRDDVDDEWQTIMRATNPAVTTFNDFEARPGFDSEYRIRTLNNYEFASFWSQSVFGAMPDGGAEGGCIDGGHLLLFTTNEVQDGTGNLAYSSAWMGSAQVEEQFTFPEAGFIQMQQMYNRDFYTAFRPMERGGEQFDRQILLQAAAVSPGVTPIFKNLLNMEWQNVNYICVRDEDGNRWLSSVTSGTGTMLRNRRLKMAQVHVAEVTDVPTPVDPDPWVTIA